MGKDLFQRDVEIGDSYRAEAARIIFAHAGDDDLILQQLSVNYQKTVNRLWEIGSNKQFMIDGRSQGALTMSKVVGPKPLNIQFFTQYGDVCNAPINTIELDLGGNNCTTIASGAAEVVDAMSLVCSGCVIFSVGFRLAAQDMVVSEDTGMLFARLAIS